MLSSPRRTLRAAKRIGRFLLERSLYLVRRFPILKPAIWSVVSIAPPLKRKLIHFSEVREKSAVVESVIVAGLYPSGTIVRLSLRARQILADLDAG